MKEVIERDGISIEMHLNDDRSVDTSKMMTVKYIHQGRMVERQMYPDKEGRIATVEDQFEYVKANIRFDQAYDFVKGKLNPNQN